MLALHIVDEAARLRYLRVMGIPFTVKIAVSYFYTGVKTAELLFQGLPELQIGMLTLIARKHHAYMNMGALQTPHHCRGRTNSHQSKGYKTDDDNPFSLFHLEGIWAGARSPRLWLVYIQCQLKIYLTPICICQQQLVLR